MTGPSKGPAKQGWREIILLVPHLWNEVLPHFLEERGFSGLWLDEEAGPPYRLVVRTYFPEERWEPYLRRELEEHLKELPSVFGASPQEPELRVRVIDDEDWASKWLPFFHPLKIGSVWIRPSAKNVRLAAGEQEIILDPGMAFGTGHHESSQQCLESILLLRPSLQDDAPVLDLGTGSGILAMFAAKVGFRNILALDTDPVAVDTALANIETNRLENFIHVSNIALRSVRKRFRLILANLSGPLLQDLIQEILLHMDRDGWLVAAGHLTSETDALLGSFYSRGLQLTCQKNKNGWGCLIFNRAFAR